MMNQEEMFSEETMFSDFDFHPPTEYDVEEVNGLPIPKDYLAFMHRHNGGEGPVGENAYMQLVALEELTAFNEEYDIGSSFTDIFIFGTDLGGMLFGYDAAKNLYCAIDACSVDEEDICYAGSTFASFLQACDAGEL